MADQRDIGRRPGGAEIIDFDAALLAACPEPDRTEVIAEAALLADAFAPEGRAEELRAMASVLARGRPSPEGEQQTDSQRARLLAAALRQLASLLAA